MVQFRNDPTVYNPFNLVLLSLGSDGRYQVARYTRGKAT